MRGCFIGFLSSVFNYMRDLNMLICKKKKKSAMEKKRLIVQKKAEERGGVWIKMVPGAKTGNGRRAL